MRCASVSAVLYETPPSSLDGGYNRSLRLGLGQAGEFACRPRPLSRRADAGYRQAGRHCRCMPARAADRISKAASTRCASDCRIRRRWPIGSTATPAAVWCSAAIRRRCAGSGALFSGGLGREGLLGRRRRRAGRGRRTDRDRAQEADRAARRLAHGRRPGRAAGGHRLPAARRRRAAALGSNSAAHRAHPSAPGPLRRARLPGRRRPGLWRTGTAGGPAIPRPVDHIAALSRPPAARDHRPGAAAHARGAGAARL